MSTHLSNRVGRKGIQMHKSLERCKIINSLLGAKIGERNRNFEKDAAKM